jgi:FtsP/CotA-like multicopper oxidase with cupredoxin domain
MSQPRTSLDRRTFLQGLGLGAAFTVTAGGSVLGAGRLLSSPAAAATTTIGLAATDGYATLPGREDDPLYIFGFIPVDPTASASSLVADHKGHAQTSAPHLGFKQNQDILITLTNLGLIQRPDLVDSHTVHWHGFDVPSPLNDGVPEVSVAVPIGRQLTYYYKPHREGTYMYHCHFEDVEHVQMGMQGIVFVTPTQENGTNTFGGFTKFAYNDNNTGSTGYNRHFALLLDEVWTDFHDGDRDIQETIPTDYDPQWFTINGRSYPMTLQPNDDPGLTTTNTTLGTEDHSQPNSALVQVNPGDRALLRIANLGYQQHAMQLPGIAMHVVGQDASWLGAGGNDLTYWTNTLYVGPGEARDVLVDIPAYDAARPSGHDDHLGDYNVYELENRDWRRRSNNGAPGTGGMVTEVRVYQNPLPAQSGVSQTYV